MATFRIKVQKQRNDGYWPVYIRVTHRRESVFIKTDKMVDDKGIVKSTKDVKDPFVVKFCNLQITDYIELLNRVDTTNWSDQEIVKFLKEGSSDICFSDYARKYHDELYNNGHERNAKTYKLAYQSVER